jgi:hypothetical protein
MATAGGIAKGIAKDASCWSLEYGNLRTAPGPDSSPALDTEGWHQTTGRNLSQTTRQGRVLTNGVTPWTELGVHNGMRRRGKLSLLASMPHPFSRAFPTPLGAWMSIGSRVRFSLVPPFRGWDVPPKAKPP